MATRKVRRTTSGHPPSGVRSTQRAGVDAIGDVAVQLLLEPDLLEPILLGAAPAVPVQQTDFGHSYLIQAPCTGPITISSPTVEGLCAGSITLLFSAGQRAAAPLPRDECQGDGDAARGAGTRAGADDATSSAAAVATSLVFPSGYVLDVASAFGHRREVVFGATVQSQSPAEFLQFAGAAGLLKCSHARTIRLAVKHSHSRNMLVSVQGVGLAHLVEFEGSGATGWGAGRRRGCAPGFAVVQRVQGSNVPRTRRILTTPGTTVVPTSAVFEPPALALRRTKVDWK